MITGLVRRGAPSLRKVCQNIPDTLCAPSNKSVGASGQVDLPEADTVEIGNSDINLDAGIAYDSSQTPSE